MRRSMRKNTMSTRFALAVVIATIAVFGISCHRSPNGEVSADAAAAQFLLAFLEAHDKKDLEAEKVLVDWDDITEQSKEHFLRETLQYAVETNMVSAKIEEIPGLTPQFVAMYNIPPEKFLVVDYTDSRGEVRVKYPIGRKEGRYYFAMYGLTREARERNNKKFQSNNK